MFGVHLIDNTLMGSQGELIGYVFEDGDLVVESASIAVSTIPPLSLCFFHWLYLDGIVGCFLAGDSEINCLIFFDVAEPDDIVEIGDLLSF